MTDTSDVITLVSLNGEPLRTLSTDTDWELEDLRGSTNRLTVTVPLEDGIGVTTEQELIFRKRRFIITETTRHRNSRTIEVQADEAQAELAYKNIRVFRLDEDTLEDAMTKALRDTKWTVKEYIGTELTFSADIEDRNSLYCLTFLANQINGTLVFDSLNRQVSIIDPETIEVSKQFRYGSNMDDISKTEIQPTATVIYPYGRDGMSIEGINDGQEFIEDYSWYESLGMTLSEARKKYHKEYVWTDERYIYSGNLLRDAKKKLNKMAHPQINYKIQAAGLDVEQVALNEPVYVVDDELGIKIKTIVVRRLLRKDNSADEIELDYVPESLGDVFDTGISGDSTAGSNSEAVFLLKNQNTITVTNVEEPVLQTSINVITSTFFTVGMSVVLNVAEAGILNAYFMLDGEKLPTKIKQSLNAGWNTIGLPFIVTQVQEGTKSFDLYMSMETGEASIEVDSLELYITSKGALGGASNKRPDRRVSDEIILPDIEIKLVDNAVTLVDKPDRHVLTDTIILPFTNLAITESSDITLDGFITPPDSIPEEELESVESRDGFGDMSKYPDLITPTQEAVNTFVDVTYAPNMVFKSISVLGQLYIFSTLSQPIEVDYIYRTIDSFEPMQILTPTDEVMDDVDILDWSTEMGIIVEHEYMLRKIEHPYQELLNNVPVPYDKEFDSWFIVEFELGTKYIYFINGKTYKYMDNPDRNYQLGSNSGAMRYIWNGDRWLYDRETTSTWNTSSDITVLYSNHDIYADDTDVIFRHKDTIGDVTYEPLVNAMTYNLPVPPDRSYDGFAIVEVGTEHRLYYINGNFEHNTTTDRFEMGTERYAYSYLWDGKEWVYRSSTSGATGWFLSSYYPMLYSSLPLLNSETGEILREADDMSLVTFKHLNELPTPPDEWLDNPYHISTWDTGDYLRLYYYTGDLVFGFEGYEWSTTENGWRSYKWTGTEWEYRSENLTGTNRSSDQMLTINNVHYTSHNFTDLEGNVVIPAGYNIKPYTPVVDLDPILRAEFGNMTNYAEYTSPTQEQVDTFITDNLDLHRTFNLVTVGTELYVIAVDNEIYVDYQGRQIAGTSALTVLEPTGSVQTDVAFIDWSAKEGNIVFHEKYETSHEYQHLLNAVPDHRSEYDGFIMLRYTSGDPIRLYYITGNVVSDKSNGRAIGTDTSGWYSYKWENGAWVYRSQSTNELGSDERDILYSSVDVLDDTTRTVFRPADSLDYVTFV